MHLFQLLLPLRDNEGNAFPADHYQNISKELTDRFGGLTAFTRAPAEGLWQNNDDTIAQDDIAVFEVMCEQLDENWWHDYKKSLEKLFAQDEIVIRAQDVHVIK